MDARQATKEIDELFGEGWFRKVIDNNEGVCNLPLEEQIEWVKRNSIHGQTYFFRDDILYPILKHIILPGTDKRPLNFAFVGCSDGREVYSLLVQGWKTQEDLEISGYDSNQDLIAEARAGAGRAYHEQNYKVREWEQFGAKDIAYIATQRKGADTSWTDIVFTEEAKKMIQFNIHNIIDSPLPHEFDVVAILNVLCHYTPKGREKILRNVRQSLTDEGWLICERCDHGSVNATKEYDGWMRNLSKFGFTKQTTIIPTWFKQDDDVSCWSRVYRKDAC